MYLVYVYFTLLNLLLNVCLLLLLIHDPTKRLLNLFARLHYLPFDHPVVDPPILLYFLQYRIFLVYSVQVPVFDLAEGPLPVVIHVLVRLDLSLLDVDDLAQMEDVLDAGLDVANELLGGLDLLVDGLGSQGGGEGRVR
jgi:hypothetical protein